MILITIEEVYKAWVVLRDQYPLFQLRKEKGYKDAADPNGDR
jgi:hypothetical protein